jgi:hypothetical protein
LRGDARGCELLQGEDVVRGHLRRILERDNGMACNAALIMTLFDSMMSLEPNRRITCIVFLFRGDIPDLVYSSSSVVATIFPRVVVEIEGLVLIWSITTKRIVSVE